MSGIRLLLQWNVPIIRKNNLERKILEVKTLPDGAIRIGSVALNYQKGNSIERRGTFKTGGYG